MRFRHYKTDTIRLKWTHPHMCGDISSLKANFFKKPWCTSTYVETNCFNFKIVLSLKFNVTNYFVGL